MDTTLTGQIDSLLGESNTTISRDLKINLKRILSDGALAPEESFAIILALARATNYRDLEQLAAQQLRTLGFGEEQIREARENVAIMGMLNTYYKFKHMLHKDDEYGQAGLRMTSLANPVLGKKQFEMLALAVSILNGCETCIQSHEKVLRASEVSIDKIHDIARLAAVIRALQILNNN